MDAEVIVIGAGASGLMAAYGAATGGRKVLVLEKMPRPARKVMITGKGRCNFTNVKQWNTFSPHIRSRQNFLRPSFYNLTPEKLIRLFSENGLECVVERGDRAYPSSYRASDVVDTLVLMTKRAGAQILPCSEVCSISNSSDGTMFIVSVANDKQYTCSVVIVSTGGLAYPSTGSTGDGYIWAERFGHSVIPCFPSLTAMVPSGYKNVPERMPKGILRGHIDRSLPLSDLGQSLCGCSLKNVEASLYSGSNLLQTEFGDMDFTDGGIEGPIGFRLSRNCVKGIMHGNRISLQIDLKPAVSEESLTSRISGLGDSLPYKVLLQKLIPKELVDGFVKSNPQTVKGKTVDASALACALKSWRFDMTGYVGYERCVVTAGGIDTEEVNPKTMQSRLCDGLYLCGEVLDIDCDTGGYNLHCAFATGLLAGQSAAKSFKTIADS